MKTPLVRILLAAGWLQALLLSVASGSAKAVTGQDPIFTRSFLSRCSLDSVRARLSPDGVSVRYWVDGACPGGRVSGEMVYRSGVFNEKFDLGEQGVIHSKGTCSDNPWVRAARCDNVSVRGEGPAVEALLAQHPFSPAGDVSAPIALNVNGAASAFRTAHDAAERPNPPNAPAGFRVTQPLRAGSVHLNWYAPDESGDRPYLHFLAQARPRAIAGAAWVELGKIQRGTSSAYSASIRLPAPLAGTNGWDIRLCSATMLAATCSEPQTPTTVVGNALLEAPNVGSLAAANPTVAKVGRLTTKAPDIDKLALEGEALAAGDALAQLLRESLPDAAARRGFDVAMAATKGQTEWGPGKQQIVDSLSAPAQSGFKTAWSYLVDRNRHAARAELGASIATADPSLELERSRDSDARYRLGFDIATAIFGDPALGAQGNTAAGPGALGIRNSLSAPAQRGFDAAMNLHLGRTY